MGSLRITTALHDEHLHSLALFERLDGLRARHRASSPPDPGDSRIGMLLADLSAWIEADAEPHFRFEEEQLFPRLAEMGEADIGELLIEEHRVILPVAADLGELVRTARRDGFTAESWRAFHALSAELGERVTSHIQKEEMGLLPMIEDLLDEVEDAQLADEYAMSQ